MDTRRTDQPGRTVASDWIRNPISLTIWWLVPIVAGNLADHLPLTRPETALVWTVALAWMGLGCVLNARRCHRRHCYISGPVLLVGAVVIAFLGWGVVSLGPNGLNLTLRTITGLVLLSCLTELIWGRYAGPR
jgi:hypothetical protein